MNPKIDELLGRIKALEEELEKEVVSRQTELRFRLENRRVRFEQEVLARHRQLKVGLLRYLAGASWRHLLSALVIYPMMVPIVLLDAGISLYQNLCFPLYRIAKVPRSEYFAFDRGQLVYLNAIEKINCTYCAYPTASSLTPRKSWPGPSNTGARSNMRAAFWAVTLTTQASSISVMPRRIAGNWMHCGRCWGGRRHNVAPRVWV